MRVSVPIAAPSAILVTQSNDGNFSDVSQGANKEMEATITQSGNRNISYVDQIARTVTASVTQSGDDNESYVTQGGQSRESDAIVSQGADNSFSDVDQTNTASLAMVVDHRIGGDIGMPHIRVIHRLEAHAIESFCNRHHPRERQRREAAPT
jgi:hypothetical protein